MFALQKSDQEDVDDIDYELDEFDDSSTEYEESECDISRPRLSSSGNHLDIHYNDSPVHFPLVANTHGSYADDTLESQPVDQCRVSSVYSPISNNTQSNVYTKYHQMVVTAVMENTNTSSTITTTADTSVPSSSPLTEGNTIPSISISFGDHPPSYDSIDYAKHESHSKSNNVNSTGSNLPEYSCIEKEHPSVETIVYVDLPEYEDEKRVPLEDGVNVVYVDIPHDNYKVRCVHIPDSGKHSKYSYEMLNNDSDSDYSCATADSPTKCGHVICKNNTKKHSHKNGKYQTNFDCDDGFSDIWKKRRDSLK